MSPPDHGAGQPDAGVRRSQIPIISGGRMIRLLALACLAALSACGVNLHRQPCPTPGVSPLASNCPTVDELKK